ncbi:transposable element Tcb2 transposase [Trichonephila clavipes]|nr:transposable element Tcb2 transposase [Trichonephila clavipes]
MWNVTDCQKVVFSDESRYVLGTDDNSVRVWRCPGPFLNGHPGAIFQQDNARPHTARVAQDFLRHFQTFPWPARSPHLSPVEHAWDQLKQQMPSCHSVHDLELAVQDLWAHLPQDNIRCLINLMLDRVAACFAAGGENYDRLTGRDVLRHGPTGPGASSRFRLGLNKIMIPKISTVKYFFRLYSPKNWKHWTICQLATCDDRRPCIGLGLPPQNLITHSVKWRQDEPVCAIPNVAFRQPFRKGAAYFGVSPSLYRFISEGFRTRRLKTTKAEDELGTSANLDLGEKLSVSDGSAKRFEFAPARFKCALEPYLISPSLASDSSHPLVEFSSSRRRRFLVYLLHFAP